MGSTLTANNDKQLIYCYYYYHSLLKDKKDDQCIWFKNLVHEEPFGY